MSLNGYDQQLRHDLIALFEGDVTAAEEAVSELCSEPDCLIAWATRMLRRENPEARMFSWEEVPPSMRDAAIRGTVMAYILETRRGITREHVKMAVVR